MSISSIFSDAVCETPKRPTTLRKPPSKKRSSECPPRQRSPEPSDYNPDMSDDEIDSSGKLYFLIYHSLWTIRPNILFWVFLLFYDISNHDEILKKKKLYTHFEHWLNSGNMVVVWIHIHVICLEMLFFPSKISTIP